MLILARDFLKQSKIDKQSKIGKNAIGHRIAATLITIMLSALTKLLQKFNVDHAMIVITGGHYGVLELTESETEQPTWTSMPTVQAAVEEQQRKQYVTVH
jgi:hypothetical protein